MLLFTACTTTTAMLFTAWLLIQQSSQSLCSSERWTQEIQRVAESMKDDPQPSLRFSTCRGARVRWYFKGKLHAS